jgi:hypothetical protein
MSGDGPLDNGVEKYERQMEHGLGVDVGPQHVVNPTPGNPMAPSLAESKRVSDNRRQEAP